MGRSNEDFSPHCERKQIGAVPLNTIGRPHHIFFCYIFVLPHVISLSILYITIKDLIGCIIGNDIELSAFPFIALAIKW